MSELKEQLLRQVEQSVNKLREHREALEEQLAHVVQEEEEARAMMQLLRNGRVETPKASKLTSHQEYMDAIDMMEDNPFTASHMVQLLGVTVGAAGQKLRVLEREGVLVIDTPRSPGVPSTVYRKA